MILGTTGRSKGVALTHHNVVSIICQLRAAWTYYRAEQDVVLGVLPFFHVFGGIALLLLSYAEGVSVVCLPRFEPALFLGSIPKYKITVRPPFHFLVMSY